MFAALLMYRKRGGATRMRKTFEDYSTVDITSYKRLLNNELLKIYRILLRPAA